MIKWKSRSEYYSRVSGTEISKNTAKQMTIVKKYKQYDYRDSTRNDNGEWCGTATIVWINECEPKRQLTIKFNKQQTTDSGTNR